MTINFTVWLIIALCASVIANIFAFWYIRRVLAKLIFVGENISDLVSILENYRGHLKGVHNLEQYYGDEDIKFVISHTTSLIELLEEEYSDVYSITVPMQIEETTEEIEEHAQTPVHQENVFYQGPRKRDS